jgi:hypothetical protein
MNNMGAIIIVRNIPTVAINPTVKPTCVLCEDIRRVKKESKGRLNGNDFTPFLYSKLFLTKNSTIDNIKVGTPNTKNTVSHDAGCVNIVFECRVSEPDDTNAKEKNIGNISIILIKNRNL